MTFSPALAAAPAGFSSDAPIEVNADALEVQQEKNMAVFTGSVVAVQGETRLKSDVMRIFYQKKEGDADAPAPAGGGLTQSKVERIEVEGNVVLTTPKESASGERGDYNVARQLIHLYGDVTLTSGQNVLKGDTLTHDMATGKSVINNPTGSAKSGGRVKALFVPEKK